MSIPNHRIVYLWQQFVAKKATQDELDELFALLIEGSQDETSRLYLQQLIEAAPAIRSLDKERWEPVLQSILQTKKVPAPGRTVFLIRRIWWAAAAVLIIGTGSYFLFFHNYDQKEITKAKEEIQYKNDVAPGGNKAILTLGNGNQIILDSAHKGMIAQQGNTKIQKVDSGRLVYSSPSRGGDQVELSFNTLTTPRGGQYQLTLPDGSRVWLNAASSIKYPVVFAGKERLVEMTGEAYFEVFHNDKQPFRVKTRNGTIEDIGTHFNVNAYDDEGAVKTTLLQGTVRIGQIILSPGQQADVNNTNGPTHIINNIDTAEVLAWKNGLFQFEKSDIRNIMRQIARWYDVEVVYMGDIKETFYLKTSRNINVSNIFKILETTGGVHLEIDGKKIIVRP